MQKSDKNAAIEKKKKKNSSEEHKNKWTRREGTWTWKVNRTYPNRNTHRKKKEGGKKKEKKNDSVGQYQIV